MVGLNTSGNPDTANYVLGRGELYFSRLTAGGFPDDSGFRDLGNAPEFSITIDVEDLEHFSSRAGLKVLDKKFVISQAASIAFTLDEISFNNLAEFVSGSTGTYDNGHDTTVSDVDVTASVVQGRWYDIYNSANTTTRRRVYNMGATGYVYSFDKDVAGVDTLLVEGTDYILDKKMGRIQIIVGSVTCPNGAKLQYTCTTAATTPKDLDQVSGLTVGTIEGALKFIQVDAVTGERTEYHFHKVQINADGDFSLIGDEVTTMGFSGAALVNNAVPDVSKVMSVRYYTPQA